MESLVANISGGVRRESVNGRDYLVAPLTMMVFDHVMHGSRGPLFYPGEEVANSAPFWDGVILTDGHLPDGTNGRKLKVQEQYGMGFVQNPVIKNKRLRAEAWFDVERTQELNPEIMQALQRGDKIELSTGLNGEFDPSPGVHNGQSYTHILRRYRPDHLAILTRERGACSIQQGCGVLNKAAIEDEMKLYQAGDQRRYIQVDNTDEQTIARTKKNKKRMPKQSGTQVDTPDMYDARLIQRTDKASVKNMSKSVRNKEAELEGIDNSWSPHAREVAAAKRKAQATGKALDYEQAAMDAHYTSEFADSGSGDYSHMDALRKHNHAGMLAAELGDEKSHEYHAKQAKEHLDKHVAERSRYRHGAPGYGHPSGYRTDNTWSDVARKAAAAAKVAHKSTVDAYASSNGMKSSEDYKKSAEAHKTAASLHSAAGLAHAQADNDEKSIKHMTLSRSHLDVSKSLKDTAAKLKSVNNTRKQKNNSGTDHFNITNSNNRMENTMSKLNETQREELITGIVTNCDCFSEDDRDELELLEDRMLTSISNGINKEEDKSKGKEKETVNNAAPKKIEVKDLPVELQRVLNYGQKAIDRDKESLIERLVVNIAKEQQEAERKYLAAKPIEDLEEKVKYLPVEKVDNNFSPYGADYSGMGVGRFVNNNTKLEPAGGSLGHADIDWSKN